MLNIDEVCRGLYGAFCGMQANTKLALRAAQNCGDAEKCERTEALVMEKVADVSACMDLVEGQMKAICQGVKAGKTDETNANG